MASSTLTNLLQSLRIVPQLGHSKSASSPTIEKPQKKPQVKPILTEITLAEVAHHDSFDDCWIVIYDRVYDVTRFLREHPGGDDVIMDHAGRDATIAFHGTGHSSDAIEQMRDFLIGELPLEQRIFRTGHTSKVLSSGIPE
ncbi:cytochrome b5 [Drosophila tropicalis]|uniref:cytochrome b5 n=1 Tax=Drosophila tropicalis TaxID=46794 RepID=UPI0035ABBEA5